MSTNGADENAPKKASSKFRSFSHEVQQLKELIVESISNFFARWSNFVFHHPYKIILLSLVSVALFSLGFLPGIPKWVDGAENLYALPYSLARDHDILHKTFFGDVATRKNALIVTHRVVGENVLTWESLESVKKIDKIVRGREIEPIKNRKIVISSNYANVKLPLSSSKKQAHPYDHSIDTGEKNSLTFEDICAIDPWGECQAESVLKMGLDEFKALGFLYNTPELMVFNGLIFNMQQHAFVPEYYLGGMDKFPCERELPINMVQSLVPPERRMPGNKPGFMIAQIECVVRAEAFMLIYEEDARPIYTERNMAWEEILISVMKDNQLFEDLHVSFQAFRSRDDELRSSTAESSDVIFVVLTFVILVSYSAGLNFSCDLYRNKACPALAGAGAALLGLVAGVGLVNMIGVPMVPTVLICPFLVMGIGVDDMFVIVNSYALSYMIPTAKDRCAVTLRDCGISITITTLTNLIAFAVGAFSPYLSIRSFCLFSAASLFLGYIYVLTFFFPVLCLDAKREENAKICLFCFPRKSDRKESSKHSSKSEEIDLDPDKNFQDISTYSLITYKVRVVNDEKLRKNSLSITFPEASENTEPRRASQKNSNSNMVDKVSSLFKLSMGSKKKRKDSKIGKTRVSPNHLDCPKNIESELQDTAHSNFSISSRPNSEKSTTSYEESSGVTSMLESYDPVLAKQAIYEEPMGNVGKKWRLCFLNYYGPFLIHPFVKGLVLIFFIILLGISAFGFTKIQQGLHLAELAPKSSYLRNFDYDTEKYFSKYDQPTDIFFSSPAEWWKVDVQESLRELHERLSNRKSSGMIVNPLIRMLDDKEIGPKLRSGDKEIFDETLYYQLSHEKSPYKQFELDFIWSGRQLITWRFKVLPEYMRTSEERASWMSQIREDCFAQQKAREPIYAVPFNYMMIFYESDLGTLSSVLTNMAQAAVAMLLVSFILIPQLSAGLLVIFIIVLIDVALFGFMYFWDIKLNMVSSIALVISIGFAVDYSAHMCHTFTHCEGKTRDLRVIESLVLMGTPVFHGAVSTFLGCAMLGLSESYIFNVFFKMMVLVVVFGAIHGVILLPVILSLIGPTSHEVKAPEKEEASGELDTSYSTKTDISQRTERCSV